MGRRYHSSRMHHMGSTWGKHGAHKHRLEVVRFLNRIREDARAQRRRLAVWCTSVSDLFAGKDGRR